ncbi:10422_t:CDS:2 [Entrophospora sp. SA101]|nr:10422_t:CDS:2 [Entrophospora sp. SA101]
MSRDLTIELQSIRDGKASIEHQLDIHVNDLFGVQDNLQLSLEDVLEGLKYVMNYRIKGGRLPNLDYEIMKRLCEGLLFNMRKSEGGLLKRKLTYEANQAFILFVEEFRQTVGEKNISDLYNSLKFHKRCRKDADPDKLFGVCRGNGCGGGGWGGRGGCGSCGGNGGGRAGRIL